MLLLTTELAANAPKEVLIYDSPYRLELGLDLAKPLIGLTYGQANFAGQAWANLLPEIAISFNFGFEGAPFKSIGENIETKYTSAHLSGFIYIKVLKNIWMGLGRYVAWSNDHYRASLSGVNFYAVTREKEFQTRFDGYAGRLVYQNEISERLGYQIQLDGAMVGQLSTGQPTDRSFASPGMAEVFQGVWVGGSIHLNYRLWQRPLKESIPEPVPPIRSEDRF
ncbi:MAG: hypothetical protein HYZ16_06815 [Bacteroidetes bacterium]|nr:hypothetical protein [Bacteroidota bacterium]